MYNKRSRGIVPLVVIAIIIAIAIAAIVSLGRAIFGGESETNVPPRNELTTVASDRSVVMTVRGPIVADEDFRSYQITISPNNRVLTTYSGYLDAVVDEERLGNNTPAYEELVYALDRAEMMAGSALSGEANDIRGICAAGRVYEFEVMRGDTIVERRWTSTCSGSPGSLEADRGQLSNLFRLQVPESRQLLRDINISTR